MKRTKNSPEESQLFEEKMRLFANLIIDRVVQEESQKLNVGTKASTIVSNSNYGTLKNK